MKTLLVILLFIGCSCSKDNKEWTTILSSDEKWYKDIKEKEKTLCGKIYDKGTTKWIIKKDRPESGIIKDEMLAYKNGEAYNRFLFETGSIIYDLYLENFWVERKMIELLSLDNVNEAKRLSNKKFEIIGKKRIVIVKEGGKDIKRIEFVPRMIRER